MQKIFTFEIDMAIKDRPKFFRFITLMLFAFSITIILISSLNSLVPSVAAASNDKKEQMPPVYPLTPTKALFSVNK